MTSTLYCHWTQRSRSCTTANFTPDTTLQQEISAFQDSVLHLIVLQSINVWKTPDYTLTRTPRATSSITGITISWKYSQISKALTAIKFLPTHFSEWVKKKKSTWFWHRVGHGLRHFIIYELHTLAGKEANLKSWRVQQWHGEEEEGGNAIILEHKMKRPTTQVCTLRCGSLITVMVVLKTQWQRGHLGLYWSGSIEIATSLAYNKCVWSLLYGVTDFVYTSHILLESIKCRSDVNYSQWAHGQHLSVSMCSEREAL